VCEVASEKSCLNLRVRVSAYSMAQCIDDLIPDLSSNSMNYTTTE
jgi:hypothetical protein